MLGPQFGVPRRMARAVQSMFAGDTRKAEVLRDLADDDQRVPLAIDGNQVGEGAFHQAADAAARECYAICHQVQTVDAIIAAIAVVCRRRGVPAPVGEQPAEVIARAVDKGWWLRQVRKEWKRRFEHVSIALGLTYVKTDPYISREMAIAQELRNRENAAMLAQVTATNEHGQVYNLGELAALGMGNKTLRRGELMMRIRGFEEVADKLRHVGMFWTITCPSKFHSVGGTNARYNGATPRDAQAYLVGVWAKMRAALKRLGIQPYGFRIAEPHSDGCPHWHMLLFVQRDHAEAMNTIIHTYALQEDGGEAGAAKNRAKLVTIEAGKGTAAGYIAKYVSKNIDGAGVGDHKAFENGQTYIVVPDMFGDVEITASQRVTYWSQVWGIRQFQQIGGAPVGVWRELRRVKAEAVANAPAELREAHAACQKIDSLDPAVAQQASFARYMMAQGGPTVGRRSLIKIAAREVTIAGKYATYTAQKPVGVYHVHQPQAVYEGVHYRWEMTRPVEPSRLVFGVPRTGVNNCTDRAPSPAPVWRPEEKIFVPTFFDGRTFDRTGAPCARVDTVGLYQRHKKRAPGAPSAHLLHLQRKYPTEG